MKVIKHILIVYKENHSAAEQLALDIQNWLHNKKIYSIIVPSNAPEMSLTQALVHTQIAIILGGDGTFLGVSRKIIEKHIPVLGINFGQVGFLAEIHPNHWQQALEQLCDHKLILQKKTILSWSVIRQNQVVKNGFAINDVVVGRGSLARILPVDVIIDEYLIGTIRSDGIIVSTPLGTSAYTISAHGPLVHPDVPALTLTSISTLFRNIPPFVLPITTNIILKPLRRAKDAFLTIDGQEGFVLRPEDSVCLHGIKNGLLIYTTSDYDYFQQLQYKEILPSMPTIPNL